MKKNTISTILLFTIFICSLFISKLAFTFVVSILAIISLREMIYIRKKDNQFPIEVELLTYIIMLFFIMNNYGNNLDFYLVDYKLLAALFLTDLTPLIIINNKKKYNLLDALYLIGSTIVLGITFNLIVQFREYNINYVIYILIITAVSYVFEYISTLYIGKTMFLPILNPKKSFEGVCGGIFMSTIISSMFLISVITTNLPIYGIFILTFVLSIFYQIGDLVFTFIKKEFNKTNFSNLKKGNSGILDIMDSIVFITLGLVLFVSIL